MSDLIDLMSMYKVQLKDTIQPLADRIQSLEVASASSSSKPHDEDERRRAAELEMAEERRRYDERMRAIKSKHRLAEESIDVTGAPAATATSTIPSLQPTSLDFAHDTSQLLRQTIRPGSEQPVAFTRDPPPHLRPVSRRTPAPRYTSRQPGVPHDSAAAAGYPTYDDDGSEDEGLDVPPTLQPTTRGATATRIQPTFAPAPATSLDASASASAPRRFNLKAEQIGTFDGSNADYFTSRIDSLLAHHSLDAAFELSVLEMLPLCFKGSAAKWFQYMPSSQRASLGQGWTQWRAAINRTFKEDYTTARNKAKERTWDWPNEDAATFYFDKTALLYAANPDWRDREIVLELMDCLPASLQCLLRLKIGPISTPEDFLNELRAQETPWKESEIERTASSVPTRRRQQASPPTPSTSSLSSFSTFSTPSKKPPSPAASLSDASPTSAAAAKQSVTSDYRPENAYYKTVNGQRVRHYKLPASGREIALKWACRTCGGDHFDFEHWHVTKPTQAQRAAAEVKAMQAYGFAMLEVEEPEALTTGEVDEESTPEMEGGEQTATSQNY
ncbi:uncharacterized protein PFL1_04009 [Pseudozyma flocculosa PF-1]|uniref:Retrotransposon gag domain-containing protein n=2 Tax=Pseudozyma flocculosa TaxID=84751 RepID=A0A5C3EWN7_9BASI|nr:uncharacterized protein PFL1_04009 [Pseudozyma flocculosa PF-1]EPQ28706.1 hypothetical protein PFL1_04009 [Pseudozyma flocculosa PF-1]SPO36663.1 uncharacterized protein PSFLO_02134 [Pseudozyma flocculosa]